MGDLQVQGVFGRMNTYGLFTQTGDLYQLFLERG